MKLKIVAVTGILTSLFYMFPPFQVILVLPMLAGWSICAYWVLAWQVRSIIICLRAIIGTGQTQRSVADEAERYLLMKR